MKQPGKGGRKLGRETKWIRRGISLVVYGRDDRFGAREGTSAPYRGLVTCGTSNISLATRMPLRQWGLCSGASSFASSMAASTSVSTTTAPLNDCPPWTTLWPTHAMLSSARSCTQSRVRRLFLHVGLLETMLRYRRLRKGAAGLMTA